MRKTIISHLTLFLETDAVCSDVYYIGKCYIASSLIFFPKIQKLKIEEFHLNKELFSLLKNDSENCPQFLIICKWWHNLTQKS